MYESKPTLNERKRKVIVVSVVPNGVRYHEIENVTIRSSSTNLFRSKFDPVRLSQEEVSS